MALVALHSKKRGKKVLKSTSFTFLTFLGRCIQPDILKLRKYLEKCSILVNQITLMSARGFKYWYCILLCLVNRLNSLVFNACYLLISVSVAFSKPVFSKLNQNKYNALS